MFMLYIAKCAFHAIHSSLALGWSFAARKARSMLHIALNLALSWLEDLRGE